MQFITSNVMPISVALMSGAMLLWSFFGNRVRGIKEVDCVGALQLINHKSAQALDVREDSEYKDGHVLNAIHIPLGKLSTRIGELEKYKGQPLVVICRNGNRSSSACVTLGKQGFAQAYNLEGGVTAWQKAKLPLQK